MKIAFASDHAGYALKKVLEEYVEKKGYEVMDFGTHSEDSCDYPDFALAAAEAVAGGACERGIFVCTSGIGVSIVANKVPGVRCALCSEPLSARMTREHNDANALALGGGYVGVNLALEIVRVFLETPFSEGVNHVRRVEKIKRIEEKYSK